ncbi:hypothetical protein [Pseudomonas sp. G5(2012)]|uniref:hypothetical protein n=1 Tax=Pseudomonas sp. G5(2012) TaxID=1268068 RepID=UPI0003431429|nr:hypothetical protein [Pseudomonas sp. G5(2012)]EPA97899.1 hypothetical protein PG5_16280 [Pseudomonas sp. G5(2012)]
MAANQGTPRRRIDSLLMKLKNISLTKIFSSVPIVFIIALLLTALGTFLGDKETQTSLQQSFPALCLGNLSFACLAVEPAARWFIALFVVFSFLFLGRELAIGRAVKAEKIEMLQALSNAPSPALLEKYAKLYDALDGAEKSKSNADVNIAVALGGLITLIKAYQPSWLAGKRVYYSAEVLLYRPISSMDERQRTATLGELKSFLYNPGNLSEVEGVLENAEGLAVEDIDDVITSKKASQRILLPIPVQKTAPGNDKISRVLAGSADAYQNSYSYIDNTEFLRELYENSNKYDLQPSLIDKEVKFFSGDGCKMKSIFSMRFGNPSENTSGVITIYCDREKLFINRSIVENFRALSRPILREIEKLLSLRN